MLICSKSDYLTPLPPTMNSLLPLFKPTVLYSNQANPGQARNPNGKPFTEDTFWGTRLGCFLYFLNLCIYKMDNVNLNLEKEPSLSAIYFASKVNV